MTQDKALNSEEKAAMKTIQKMTTEQLAEILAWHSEDEDAFYLERIGPELQSRGVDVSTVDQITRSYYRDMPTGKFAAIVRYLLNRSPKIKQDFLVEEMGRRQLSRKDCGRIGKQYRKLQKMGKEDLVRTHEEGDRKYDSSLVVEALRERGLTQVVEERHRTREAKDHELATMTGKPWTYWLVLVLLLLWTLGYALLGFLYWRATATVGGLDVAIVLIGLLCIWAFSTLRHWAVAATRFWAIFSLGWVVFVMPWLIAPDDAARGKMMGMNAVISLPVLAIWLVTKFSSLDRYFAVRRQSHQ